MEWVLLFLMLWIVYTVLLALNGAFHEDDKDLYVMAGAMCSGICVVVVFIVWLIVRLMV